MPLIKATFPREWILQGSPPCCREIQESPPHQARWPVPERRSPLGFSHSLSFSLLFSLAAIYIHTWNAVAIASSHGYNINNPITSFYCRWAVRCEDIVFRGLGCLLTFRVPFNTRGFNLDEIETARSFLWSSFLSKNIIYISTQVSGGMTSWLKKNKDGDSTFLLSCWRTWALDLLRGSTYRR